MVEFVAVVTTAFALQLLALPGEKAQVVIAGLATRYDPYAVVAGAGSAFAGWTAIEILVGNALRGALPQIYLDTITGVLFMAFGVLLLYASRDGSADIAPQSVTDGGYRLSGALPLEPGRLNGFVPSFSLVAFGEVGDKTQLVTIGLAAQYGAHPGIWLGEMLAIIPVSLATALFFDRIAGRFDTVWLYRLSAVVFFLFAADIAATYLLGWSLLPI
jgi:putative Ca2+/H+ antiporter (TMEM165/GDT1 family)